MKLLILEFICGGCWEDPELPTSLHKEGWLMLQALLEDASKIPNYEIYTTWDERLGKFPRPGVNVTTISRPQDFKSAYVHLLNSVEQVLIIAPEFENHLYKLVNLTGGTTCIPINCSPSALNLTSNKSLTKNILRDHHIPTIKDLDVRDKLSFPFVKKPVDGAGSTDNWCIRSKDDWDAYQSRNYTIPMLTEEYIPGQHYSMGVIVNQAGSIDYLPLAVQHIEIGRQITYQGGQLPATNINQQPFQQLVERCLQAIPGLRGYFGVDMILPDNSPQQPVVVEINPRLTTSYIGYRQLTGINLLERMLSKNIFTVPIPWADQVITWNVQEL